MQINPFKPASGRDKTLAADFVSNFCLQKSNFEKSFFEKSIFEIFIFEKSIFEKSNFDKSHFDESVTKNPSLKHTCLNNHKVSPRPLDDSCIKTDSYNGSFCMSFCYF